MSHCLKKPTKCLGENKGADQRLCFRYVDSTFPLFKSLIFKLLACFFAYTSLFVLDLVGNPEDQFSRVTAHIL